MRKVLLRFMFDPYWTFQSVDNELHIGVGWLLVLWTLIATGALAVLWHRTRSVREVAISLGFWSIIPLGLLFVVPNLPSPKQGPSLAEAGIPVFGYGFMMFVGFSMATLLALYHARRIEMDPNIIMDLMMWVLIPGLIGARALYVFQYSDRIFGNPQNQGLVGAFKSLIALWDGGLVFYGSVIGGAIGGWIFCRRRDISPLKLADVVSPSLFVGLGFGRIGCFLYGCCYGGACDLPWAVRFPPGSLTYEVQMREGIIQQGAASTTALHPTQIYSSLLAFLLAGILTWLFRRRPFEGFVVGMMFVLYPVNRFILELIRSDEKGQLGTSLTISQLISIGLFILGITTLVRLSKQSPSGQ